MKEITDSTFEAEVLLSGKPTVVDFWAPWCGPCRAMTPVLDSLDSSLPDVLFVKMNSDENTKTPASFGVKGLPTLIVFDGGYEVKRIVGFRGEKDLKEKLAEVLTD